MIFFGECSQNIGENSIPVSENHPSILKIKETLTQPSFFNLNLLRKSL